MSDVRAKYVPPALNLRAFNCPNCGVLTTQTWHPLAAEWSRKKDSLPTALDKAMNGLAEFYRQQDLKFAEQTAQFVEARGDGWPHLGSREDVEVRQLRNAKIARCSHCYDTTIWFGEQLVWPRIGSAPLPNADMPGDVRGDYSEASTILDLSPRGAAALLRLAVQKLCAHLGEKGKNINEDIASLVAKGLDPRVQQALDTVRVIGNEAVHPGVMDLRDDRATAERLFGLVRGGSANSDSPIVGFPA